MRLEDNALRRTAVCECQALLASPRHRALSVTLRFVCAYRAASRVKEHLLTFIARAWVCMCACVRVFESCHQCNAVIGTTQRSLRRPDYEEPFVLVPVLTLFDDARCHLLSWSCANCSRPILWSSACAFCPEDVVLPILVVLLVALVLLVHC